MQIIAREASPRRRYFRGSPSLRPWLALALLLTGCNQLERIDTGGGAGTELPADVVLAFERSCGTSPACHAAGGQSPTLDATVGSSLIGAAANASNLPLVTIGDTANSYLAIKMLPDSVIAALGATRTGARMPLGFDYATGSADTLADTETILAWIGGADFPGGGGGGSTGGGMTTGGDTTPTFTRVKNEIFAASCSCHLAAPAAFNGNLSLQLADAYTNIVGVKSGQATTTDLIAPGDPTISYLYLKLTGAQATVPGGGDGDMPDELPPLPADKLTLMEDWILAGALDD